MPLKPEWRDRGLSAAVFCCCTQEQRDAYGMTMLYVAAKSATFQTASQRTCSPLDAAGGTEGCTVGGGVTGRAALPLPTPRSRIKAWVVARHLVMRVLV